MGHSSTHPERKAYVPPVLTLHGDVGTLTHNVTQTGMGDNKGKGKYINVKTGL
jgi:hypothetical protein